jgi:hypothetical protein
LFEIVNKAMSLDARTSDIAAFKADVDQAVMKKARQLDGTAALLRRDPQPAGSPLREPASTVFPIVVCGNHFPVNPVTRNDVEESLRNAQSSARRPLALMNQTSTSGRHGHDGPRLHERPSPNGLASLFSQVPLRTHLGRMRLGTGGDGGGRCGTAEVPLTCSDESMGDQVGCRGLTVVRLENR